MKKSSWRDKSNRIWGSIFGNRKVKCDQEPFPPAWLDTGDHIYETSGKKFGDVEADRKWGLERLEREWQGYERTVYTDGSASDGTKRRGGGVIVTTGPPSAPTVKESYAIPTGH